MDDLRTLDPDQLVAQLRALVARSHRVGAAIVAHLAEMERRRAHLDLGYPSLYAWCVDVLHLSDDAAAKRIRVARAVRDYPLALAYLADGRLHVSGLLQLSPRLTEDTHRELLDAASGKSCADIRRLLAERFPSPDVATSVRRKAPAALPLPSPASKRVSAPRDPNGRPASTRSERDAAPASGALELSAPADRGRVEPLSKERYAVRFTASASLVGKLDELRAVLAPTVRSGDLGELLELAVDELLARTRKRRFGTSAGPRELEAAATRSAPGPLVLEVPAPERPDAGPGATAEAAPEPAAPCEPAPALSTEPSAPETSRYVPIAVRRAVYERDGGRCTFEGPDGHRCAAEDVELDHIQPFALGGRHTAAGMRLRCRRHNLHAARETFGDRVVDARIAQSRRRPRRLAPATGRPAARSAPAALPADAAGHEPPS